MKVATLICGLVAAVFHCHSCYVVQAWMPPILPSTRQSSTHQAAARSTAREDDDNDATWTRRQWMTSLISTAAATVAASCMSWPTPATAAELVSSPSVCNPTVSVWQHDNRLVYLLGTDSVKKKEVSLARNLVREIHPEGVFVELDPKRVKGEGGTQTKVQKLLEKKGPNSKVIIPNVQVSIDDSHDNVPSSPMEKMAMSSDNPGVSPTPPKVETVKFGGRSIQVHEAGQDKFGIKANEEYMAAIDEGLQLGSKIILGDRDIDVTLRHVVQSFSQTGLAELTKASSSFARSITPTGGSSGDLPTQPRPPQVPKGTASAVPHTSTRPHKADTLEVMNKLRETTPAVYNALISERDAYMAAALNNLNEFETIVAVIGIAHVEGVKQNLQQSGWTIVHPACQK